MSLYRGRAWKRLGSVIFVYVVLALIFTYPLVLRLGTSTLGWPGDNLEYVWKMWWLKNAILDVHRSPFLAPQVYYPYGMDMASGEMTLAHTFLGIPLTAAFGPTASYNIMILLSFVLSGLGMYLLVSEYTEYPIAALAGGIAFAFCAYRIAHSPGHLNLMGTQWIPFAFWAIERWKKRARWQWAGLAGLFFSLTALSSWYLAVFMVLAFGTFVVLRLRPWKRDVWHVTTIWSALAFLIVAGLLTVPLTLPYLRLLGRGDMAHSFATVVGYSADPTDFFVPNLLHPLWGNKLQSLFVSQARLWVERSIYLSWVALFLAVFAILVRRRDSSVQAYAAVAVVACVLALGPVLRWGGEIVALSLPESLEDLFTRIGLLPILVRRFGTTDGRFTVPLPAQVLRLTVPVVTPIRVWARMGLFAAFAVAALAGIGLDRLLTQIDSGWSPMARRIVGWLAVALFLFDLAAIPPLWPISSPFITSTEPRAVDLWLKTQDDGSLIEFPISLQGSQLFYSIAHSKPIVTGYGTFVPQHFEEKVSILETFPREGSLAVLQDWQVRYVLVNSVRYGSNWPAMETLLEKAGELELAYESLGIHVYILGPRRIGADNRNTELCVLL